MKAKFTLTMIVRLPDLNTGAYPGCSSPEDAIKQELQMFKDKQAMWVAVALSNADSVVLEANLNIMPA